MSSILLSIILSMAPYHWVCRGQDTALKKEELKVVMYPGFPPESLSEDIRKSPGPEKPPALTAKVAVDGKFQAESPGIAMEGQITKIDGDKIEIIIQNATLNTTGSFDIKAVVKLNEPIIPKAFSVNSIVFLHYFRITRNTEEKEAKPDEVRPPAEKWPGIKVRQN